MSDAPPVSQSMQQCTWARTHAHAYINCGKSCVANNSTWAFRRNHPQNIGRDFDGLRMSSLTAQYSVDDLNCAFTDQQRAVAISYEYTPASRQITFYTAKFMALDWPRKKWIDNIRDDFVDMGTTITEATQWTANRWYGIVEFNIPLNTV